MRRLFRINQGIDFTRQKPEISAEQKEELQRWVRRPKTSQALVLRARIILASESEASNMTIAAQLAAASVDPATCVLFTIFTRKVIA